jgi:sec-independent protein translocase protein TatB
MLDIGWQEFTLVAFILLIIVGPKDLPKVLKSIFKSIDKIKNYAYDFKSSVNEMLPE